MNVSQKSLLSTLVAAMALRGFDKAEYALIDNASVQDVAVGNWRVNANSVCIQWTPESVNGKTFPIIELRPSGIPAMPEVSTYNESGNKHGAFISTDDYGKVADWHDLHTSFDNALFGDLHVGKTRKARSSSPSVARLPKLPVIAVKPVVAAVPVPDPFADVPAPVEGTESL